MFVHPNTNELDNIVGGTDCMQDFHKFKYKRDYKVKFVRGEIGEEVASFKITNRCRKIYEPIHQQNELVLKMQGYEQGESDFCFDSILEITTKFLDTMI